MIVKYQDGKTEHKRGPIALFEDPVVHVSVHLEEALKLESFEAIVVYKEKQDNKQVERKIVRGPMLFIPEPNEWTHQFCWHGTDSEDKTKVIPAANKFVKLKLIAEQL